MIINPFENLNSGTQIRQTVPSSSFVENLSNNKNEDPFSFIEEKYSVQKASYTKTSRYVHKQN